MLERTARAEKLPFQDVQRARIVLYAAQGVSDCGQRVQAAARLEDFVTGAAEPPGDGPAGARRPSTSNIA